ncbi:HET domain-containing protein [Fusarium falciforme]|uniref:HET domain-containing protein n=1 Tax=Fusarium falciforme TaxID=195108 RepID=UPI0023018AFD|nr:HET domain-containing protein [Fusarium falciforme]WAO84917.1 HET domain-containing protein [Fusarium falciforme]
MLLDHGANPNLKDFDRATPLWHAAKEGHTTTMALLTKCGVNVNVASTVDRIDLHTPLSLALTNGLSEMVSLLLAQPTIQPRVRIKPSNTGKYTPCTPLGLAHGHEETVRLLLNNGADVNTQCDSGKTPLHLAVEACNGAHVNLVTLLLSQVGVLPDLMDKDGDTPALLATSRGQIEILRFLLAKGVGTEAKTKDGLILLGVAAEQGYLPIVELLLATDDVDAQSRDAVGRTSLTLAANPLRDRFDRQSNSEDLEGRMPLSLAAERGQLQVLEKLLSLKGAMPNTRDNTGCTPLSWPVQSNRKNVSVVIKRLLGAEGVDPNAEDKGGWTPLSLAVQDNKASGLVELLLTEGAGRIDINHEDREGRTPLTLALKRGYEVVVGQLRAAGAREKKDEDEKQQGIEIFRAEADGAACEKEAKTQQESDGDPQSALSGEDSSTDSWEKNRWQRERLCGVPIVLGRSDRCDGPTLEAFAKVSAGMYYVALDERGFRAGLG